MARTNVVAGGIASKSEERTMIVTWDPSHNIAYIRLREKRGDVETVAVGDERSGLQSRDRLGAAEHHQAPPASLP
ncbi:MAG: hypothetical protein QME96_16455 [Myxococcota bacterium]|nr:hypothetical protein [Myxococcota bacterium]